VTELTPEQVALCRLLGQGLSLADAATQLHLSRRTAFRRLASVREALNVESTREAVLISVLRARGGSVPLNARDRYGFFHRSVNPFVSFGVTLPAASVTLTASVTFSLSAFLSAERAADDSLSFSSFR